MNNKKELITVILICIFGAVLWYIYYGSYKKYYTIGSVIRKETGLKSGTVAKFTYFYEGKKYEGGTGIGDYEIKIGDKYVVEFAKKKVDLSKALFYYPIPDSVMMEIPREGWEDVPSNLKKYRRKRMEFFGFYDEIFNN
jgi:hypothetical protein